MAGNIIDQFFLSRTILIIYTNCAALACFSNHLMAAGIQLGSHHRHPLIGGDYIFGTLGSNFRENGKIGSQTAYVVEFVFMAEVDGTIRNFGHLYLIFAEEAAKIIEQVSNFVYLI